MSNTNNVKDDNLRGELAAIITASIATFCDAISAARHCNINDVTFFETIVANTSPEKLKEFNGFVNRLRIHTPQPSKRKTTPEVPAIKEKPIIQKNSTHLAVDDIVAVANGEELTLEKALTLNPNSFHVVLYMYGRPKLEIKLPPDCAGHLTPLALSEKKLGFTRLQIVVHLMKERGVPHTRSDLREINTKFVDLSDDAINHYMSLFYHLFGQKNNEGPYLIGKSLFFQNKNNVEITYMMNPRKKYLVLYRDIEFPAQFPPPVHCGFQQQSGTKKIV